MTSRSISLVRRTLEFLLPLLRLLMWPLHSFSRLVFPPSDLDGLSPAVTSKAAQQFVSHLRSVASTLPPSNSNSSSTPSSSRSSPSSTAAASISDVWMTTGFAAAKAEALQNNALLFVYIHSPLHPQSQSFLQRVLLSESMTMFLNQPYINALGVSLHSAQGAQLSHLLQIDAYPFVALLQPRERTLQWMVRAGGTPLLEWQLESMLSHMQAALTRHEVQVADDLARRLQRQEEQELRRQQDEEYQAALRADQERERQRREEEERERLKVLEEEEKLRKEREEKENVLETAKAQVRPEPKSGGTSIRFVLPSGNKLNRRFECDETMAGLKAFLTLYFYENNIEMGRIGLSTSFPRKTYNEPKDEQMTLKEEGLSPQAVLMVQDLDA